MIPATTTRTTTSRPARPAAPVRRGVSLAGNRPRTRHTGPGTPRGFTLIELLVVIVILGILMALLLPAINSALRTSREAAVQAEINQLAQAIEQFKSKYGDYPPSRFLAIENGNYTTGAFSIGNTSSLAAAPGVDPTSPGTLDISVGQLAQRSLTYLRKFWPRLNTTGNLPAGTWYDFNGNGIPDPAPYVLHGHECLVFFLGGVPLHDAASNTWSVSGFGPNPTNPFTNNLNNGNNMYNPNRQPPLFEFNAGRLFVDPASGSGMPAYYDSLTSGPPTGANGMNFYAYFSAYGSNGYDPNDVNFYNPNVTQFAESDTMGNQPIWLQYVATFPTFQNSNIALSPSPNPYTTTLSATATGTVTYQKPQSYQILSAGVNGQYGVGGQYAQTPSSSSVALPFDIANTAVGASPMFEASLPAQQQDLNLRQREYDNLTNFKAGRLQ